MNSTYLLSGQASEIERLQLQSRVWEDAGRALLAQINSVPRARALDAGCGVMGWLRILSAWVGPHGEVLGTDIDEKMLGMARRFVHDEGLRNVSVARDDLFASTLQPASFDLVHARFQLAPLGCQREQATAYLQLLKPGGILVLEDPDTASWRFNPPSTALQRLIGLIEQSFVAGGGDFNAGRTTMALLDSLGLRAHVRAEVVALSPGHPYLRLPIQFASALRPRLQPLLPADELDALLAEAERDLGASGRWGLTFTLVQTWAEKT